MDLKQDVVELAINAMVEFKRVVGRHLSPSMLGELYAAHHLGLTLSSRANEQGFDLNGPDRQRYQVKQRAPTTLNVDLNNVEFDHLLLVNLGDDYRLLGIWRMDVRAVREAFVFREKFRKYQATQQKVKELSTRVV